MVLERRGPVVAKVDDLPCFVGVPIFDKETKEIEHIFEFKVIDRLPLWRGREVYRALCAGEPSRVDYRNAYKQAYAVCKKTLKEKKGDKRKA